MIITRCGYRCDWCLAYGPNIDKYEANRQILSDGWYKYFGFRIESENIRCEGCLSKKDNPKLIDQNCPVRPCVIQKGYSTCAECKNFICQNLKVRIVNRKEVEKRLGHSIPENDYIKFIKPYESLNRLKKLNK
jgi:hypothetical protein